MIDLTPILQVVLAAASALITAFVIPWIKSKLSEERQETLAAWVKTAVAAAEQTIADGNKKKAYVIAFLEAKGYTVDLEDMSDELDAMIEAAVYALNNGA